MYFQKPVKRIKRIIKIKSDAAGVEGSYSHSTDAGPSKAVNDAGAELEPGATSSPPDSSFAQLIDKDRGEKVDEAEGAGQLTIDDPDNGQFISKNARPHATIEATIPEENMCFSGSDEELDTIEEPQANSGCVIEVACRTERFDSRSCSVMEDSIRPFKPALNHRMSIDEGDETIKFPRWLSLRRTKRKKKGIGMTRSELPSEVKALPGLQALLANYARMLFIDRENFVKTLFRAVKLNKLDVTRILCKIVQKSDMTLSCKKLREPQSSATVLHVAVLYDSVDIVNYLVKQQDTELIMAKYETEEYRNQTVMHVAVAGGNTNLLRVLLESLDEEHKEELVNTVADGRYFKANHPFGALCLTTAAWAGRGEIIKELVRHGANPLLKTRRGKTLLHCLILQSAQYPKRTDYQKLLAAVWESIAIWASRTTGDTIINMQQRELQLKQNQIDKYRQLLAMRNNDGYTPLKLGAEINSMLYECLIDTETIYKIPQNTLGSLTFVTYDVSDITSFANNRYNKYSILYILAHSSSRLSLKTGRDDDLLETEPINALLRCKWGVYRIVYIIWMLIHLCFMIVFTSMTMNVNSVPFTNATHPTNKYVDGNVYPSFAAFLVIPIIYLILELLDLFGNQPYRIQYMSNQNYVIRVWKCLLSEWTIIGNGPYRLVMIAFCVAVLDWFVKYSTKDDSQEISLALALLLGWIFVLFFTRACRVTCKFSTMIQKMFFRDLTYFLTVYGIILVAFTFAIRATFFHIGSEENILSQVLDAMMNVVLGLGDKTTGYTARQHIFTKLLQIFYAIMAVILLVNMLIAMMNTSYETVRISKCNLWQQQQLSVMLMLERRLFWWRWLCCKSERHLWRKAEDDEESLKNDNKLVRSYIDVTVLQTDV